jgi:hypothetical protein
MFWNTGEGQRNFTWEPTFYVERQITSLLDLFIEYAGDCPQRGGCTPDYAHWGRLQGDTQATS